MNFNLEGIEAFEKEVASTGSDVFRMQELVVDIPKSFRLQGATAERQNGIPMVKAVTFFINSKPYLSLSTFKEACPLLEEYNKAKKSGDVEVQALLNSDNISIRNTVLFNALVVDVKYNDAYEVVSVGIEGGKPRALEVSTNVSSKILKFITDAKNKAQCGIGSIANREKGRNIILTKSGSGKTGTKYDADIDTDMIDMSDAKYDMYYENTMDIWAYLETFRKDPDYLRAVARNFFYAEPLESPEDTPATSAPKQGSSLLDGLDKLDTKDD